MEFPSDLQEILRLIEQSDDRTRYDIFYFLFSQLSLTELQSLHDLLANQRTPDMLNTFLDAQNGWQQYGISMGTIPQDAPHAEHLMFHLGRLEHFSQPVGFATMGVPNYYGIGRHYLDSVKKELQVALCSKSGAYNKDRKKLAEIGHTSLTIAVPAIMAALSLPPTLAGVAVVMSVFISKIGMNAFCRMLNEQSGQPSATGKDH